MSLFVYRIQLLLSVVLQVFQNRHHNVQKDYMTDSCYVSRFCKVCSYVIPEVHNIKDLRWAVSDVITSNYYFYKVVVLV